MARDRVQIVAHGRDGRGVTSLQGVANRARPFRVLGVPEDAVDARGDEQRRRVVRQPFGELPDDA